jgi:hypothetical protein
MKIIIRVGGGIQIIPLFKDYDFLGQPHSLSGASIYD